MDIAAFPAPPKPWPFEELSYSGYAHWMSWMSARYFELFHMSILTSLKPPAVVVKSVAIIQSDPKLRYSQDVVRRLEVVSFDKPLESIKRANIWYTRILVVLCKQAQMEGGVTLSMIQRQIMQMAAVVLEIDDAKLDGWRHFFSPYLVYPTKDHGTWGTVIKPTLEQLIDLVESYRTLEWQQDPDRRLPRLPRTFPMRLMLRIHPFREEGERVDCQAFAFEISDIIRLLVDGPQLDRRGFEDLKDVTRHFSAQLSAELACILGALPPNVEDLAVPPNVMLKVELADALMRKRRADEKMPTACLELVNSWLRSACEAVRDRAWALKHELTWPS